MFNRPENQNYVGEMPSEDMYGPKHMDADTYNKKIKPLQDHGKKQFVGMPIYIYIYTKGVRDVFPSQVTLVNGDHVA